jgi:hypothetical protein
MQMGYAARFVKTAAELGSNSRGAPVGARIVRRFDMTVAIAHERAGVADIFII